MPMTPEELKVISDLINNSTPDMEAIRKIIDESVVNMEGRLEKAIDSKFKQLEDQINSTQKHSEDLIRNRVSDKTCEHHRKDQGERVGELSIKVATVQTTLKLIGTIVVFTLGMLIPALIGGIVYGIRIYEQVQTLLQ